MNAPNRFKITKSAANDLAEIWSYTHRTWGEQQADRYTNGMKAKCQQLASNPDEGRLMYEIGFGLHCVRYEHHFIFYLLEKESISIIGFLHERMDVFNRLRDRIA